MEICRIVSVKTRGSRFMRFPYLVNTLCSCHRAECTRFAQWGGPE